MKNKKNEENEKYARKRLRNSPLKLRDGGTKETPELVNKLAMPSLPQKETPSAAPIS